MINADSLALLGQSTIAASAAILLVLLLRGKLRSLFGARMAYAFWMIVPLAALASLLPADVQVAAPELTAPVSAPASLEQTAPAPAAAPTATKIAPLADSRTGGLLAAFSAVSLTALWSAGFVITLSLQLVAHLRFIRRHKLTASKSRVCRADSNDVAPSVVGLLKPYMVVPRNFAKRFSRLERALIFAHERAHLKAGDLPANLLALVIRSIFWFNPLMYAAHRLFRVDQELACDERVMVRHSQHRRIYAETLLKSQLMTQSSPLACAWVPGGLHPLKERIARLSHGSLSLGRRLSGALSLVIVAGLTSSVAWATLSTQVVYLASSADQQAVNDGDDWDGDDWDKDDWDEDDADRGDDAYDVREAQGAALVNALLDRRYNHARALIDAGADVNYGLRGDGTPLIVVARRGHMDMMQLLLDRGADPDGYVAGDGTPLVAAARRENIEVARFLLERGANVNEPAPGDGNPLIQAAREGNMDLVTMFVEAGADVDGFVLGDETPLIGASRNNRLDVAEYLIAQGADVNLRVPTGNGEGRAQYRSPLGQARLKGHRQMARLLRDAGATDVTERED